MPKWHLLLSGWIWYLLRHITQTAMYSQDWEFSYQTNLVANYRWMEEWIIKIVCRLYSSTQTVCPSKFSSECNLSMNEGTHLNCWNSFIVKLLLLYKITNLPTD